MFRKCSQRLAVSMYSLFMVEQKSNPVLQNLPIPERGKLLGKLYRSLSPDDKLALEQRAAKTKQWKHTRKYKNSKKIKSLAIAESKVKSKTDKDMFNQNTTSHKKHNKPSSNRYVKSYSQHQHLFRKQVQHNSNKHKLQGNKSKSAHKRISQIAHDIKKRTAGTLAGKSTKGQHVSHHAHKSIANKGSKQQHHHQLRSHTKSPVRKSHTTLSHHAHKSVANKGSKQQHHHQLRSHTKSPVRKSHTTLSHHAHKSVTKPKQNYNRSHKLSTLHSTQRPKHAKAKKASNIKFAVGKFKLQILKIKKSHHKTTKK